MANTKFSSIPMCLGKRLPRNNGTPFEQPSIYRRQTWALQHLTMATPNIDFVVNKLSVTIGQLNFATFARLNLEGYSYVD